MPFIAVTDNLRKNMPDITVEKTDRLRQLMNTAVRDCLVASYEPLIVALDLPDPDDRHVLAAAIKAKAQIIVTKNLRDFPPERLAPWDLSGWAELVSTTTAQLARPDPTSQSPTAPGLVTRPQA
ncbi:MAG TPA: PIN domain-containing protein [Streptosporangiaceae bacterium]|jgi:hypothetical protein|nr:PIN domain-containing protein [Streptosporangiaceae bacterium]